VVGLEPSCVSVFRRAPVTAMVFPFSSQLRGVPLASHTVSDSGSSNLSAPPPAAPDALHAAGSRPGAPCAAAC
jgi:hypothetical protein